VAFAPEPGSLPADIEGEGEPVEELIFVLIPGGRLGFPFKITWGVVEGAIPTKSLALYIDYWRLLRLGASIRFVRDKMYTMPLQ
jgi:hypothetical protein